MVLVSMRDTQKHLSGQNTCDSLGKTLTKREEEILCHFYFENDLCRAASGEEGVAAGPLFSL